METKTLASTPKNAEVAISTPNTINYVDTVKRCAHRKVENGSQFSSTKGKQSLLIAVTQDVRSQLGIRHYDDNRKLVPIPDEHFQECKRAIESFWHNEASDMVKRAIENDAKITTRQGILMTRKGKGDKLVRSKTDRFTSVYAPKANEHKFCDMIGLSSAKSRLDAMLDNVGKWSREELDAQRRWIEKLEQAISESK